MEAFIVILTVLMVVPGNQPAAKKYPVESLETCITLGQQYLAEVQGQAKEAPDNTQVGFGCTMVKLPAA